MKRRSKRAGGGGKEVGAIMRIAFTTHYHFTYINVVDPVRRQESFPLQELPAFVAQLCRHGAFL